MIADLLETIAYAVAGAALFITVYLLVQTIT